MNGHDNSRAKLVWLPVLLATLVGPVPCLADPPVPGVVLSIETPGLTLAGLSFDWTSDTETFPGSFSVTRKQDPNSTQLIEAYYFGSALGEVTIVSGGLTVTLGDAALVGYAATGGQDPKGNNQETFTFRYSTVQWAVTGE